MSRLLEESPDLLRVPRFIEHAHRFWGFVLLGNGMLLFRETGIRSVSGLLYDKYGIPEAALPVLYILFGAPLLFWPRYPRYWQAFVWSIPLWVHVIAAVVLGVPYSSVFTRAVLIVAFVGGTASVQEFIRRHG